MNIYPLSIRKFLIAIGRAAPPRLWTPMLATEKNTKR